MAVIEQRLHQKRYATNLEHVFGDIATSWFQIRDIRCLFEDFGDIEQVELDSAFMGDRRQMQGSIGRSARCSYHRRGVFQRPAGEDRKSTRLNSSHGYISYAVFCLKK